MKSGRVIEYRHTFYWVPDGVNDENLHCGDELEHDPTVGETVEIDNFHNEEKAEAWAKLQELGASYEDRPVPSFDGPTATDTEHETVPVVVAKEGKAKIAAYLYCRGHSKLAISHAINVSERTVNQYISDVRRGER